MPDRRYCWRQRGVIGGQLVYLDFGEREDGSLGEVFITVSKAGTFSRGVMDALARVLSVALQNGVTPLELTSAMRNLNFPPQGSVTCSGSVNHATSVVDWIAQEIENAYCRKES